MPRISWIDNGKFICIICVMMSHLESCTVPLLAFFSPFFLSAFFFFSGYVYNPPDSFKIHLGKKFRSLFVPWFIFSNFNILLSAIITLKGERNTLSELFWNFLQIRGHGDDIWFVAALFVAYIPFFWFVRWNNPLNAILVSVSLSVLSDIYANIMPSNFFPWNSAALPWHLEYVFQAMFWMILGYYFRLFAEKKFEMVNQNYYTLLVTVVYILCLNHPPIPYISGYVTSLLGICMIILWAKQLPSTRYMQFIGANTLTYFALHGKVYAVLEFILGKFSFYEIVLSNELLSSLFAVLLTIIMSLLLIIPALIINRYFPWTLGRSPKRNA